VGLGKGFGVTIVFVGGMVMSGEVGMKAGRGSGGLSGRGGRGRSLIG